ncbi:SH3 domain-containing protein [Actinorhabdospora filicis]|nr:SH3 domain-containing protein [Actinorhabdospora filicis]
MSKFATRSLVVLVLGVLALIASPLAAQASTGDLTPSGAPSVSKGHDDATVAAGCEVKSKVAGLNVRRTASASATSIGQMQKGNTADAVCTGTKGGTYTACGVTFDQWIKVYWNGAWGYVASYCVDWYHD